MLPRREVEFLKDSRSFNPTYRRVLKHHVKEKLEFFLSRDLPAIMANDWSRGLFLETFVVEKQ